MLEFPISSDSYNESLLTSELLSEECLLMFLLMVFKTASSISPTKVSSFSAVSGRHTKDL